MTEKNIAIAIVFLIVVTAIGVVFSKHQSRLLFAQQQKSVAKLESLESHWGRLLLEEAALTGHGAVERVARKELNMFVPKYEQMVKIQ